MGKEEEEGKWWIGGRKSRDWKGERKREKDSDAEDDMMVEGRTGGRSKGRKRSCKTNELCTQRTMVTKGRGTSQGKLRRRKGNSTEKRPIQIYIEI